MKKEIVFAIFAFAILSSSFASAEIFMSHLENAYNAGDDFSFNITMLSSFEISDFLIIKLICTSENESDSREIYRIPLTLNAGEQKIIPLDGKFNNFLIGSLSGKCYLNALFGESEKPSTSFDLTRELNVEFSIDKLSYNPGESIFITGKAEKKNREAIKGAADISINGLSITSSENIFDGSLNSAVFIPEDTPAGMYTIDAKFYDRDSSGKVMNEGKSSLSIKVNQVVRKISVAIGAQNVTPENEQIYSVVFYDQTEQEAEGNASIQIIDSNGSIAAETSAIAGETKNFSVVYNATPGEWTIKANAQDLNASSKFYVEELHKALFQLINKTLIVKNGGNVPYSKAIIVTIGEEKEPLIIELGVGEEKFYILSAPEGNYEISIEDDGERTLLGTSFLTGNAIGIRGFVEGGLSRFAFMFLWILLIGAGVVFGYRYYNAWKNKAYTGTAPALWPVGAKKVVYDANSGLASEGTREECAVVTLKVKNLAEIENQKNNAFDAIERALSRARDANAKVYSDGDFKTIIFAPSLTNDSDNNLRAVRAARAIERILLEHNGRFDNKVSFGIGVHGGEMIVEKRDNSTKIHSIGSIIPAVKNIAQAAGYGIGVSEHVHRRLLGKVKSAKDASGNFWRIKKLNDREEYSDFIGKFMNKQREEAKK